MGVGERRGHAWSTRLRRAGNGRRCGPRWGASAEGESAAQDWRCAAAQLPNCPATRLRTYVEVTSYAARLPSYRTVVANPHRLQQMGPTLASDGERQILLRSADG